MIPLLLKAMLHHPDKQQLLQFKAPSLPDVFFSQDLFIEPQHYQRYCRLVEWPLERTMHPCYLQMLSLDLQMQCLTHRQSPFPVLGLVHVNNDIRHQHPLTISAQIELRAGFKKVLAHKKGWEVIIEVTGYQSGVLVYQALSGYLVRAKAPHVTGEKSAPFARQHHYSQWDLKGSLDAPANIGRKYARLSGDYNPIHLHAASAKLFGFQRAIAHGMWSLARCVSQVAPEAGEAKGWAQIQCEFVKPWLLPGEGILKQNRRANDGEFALLDTSEQTPYLNGTVALRDAGFF